MSSSTLVLILFFFMVSINGHNWIGTPSRSSAASANVPCPPRKDVYTTT